MSFVGVGTPSLTVQPRPSGGGGVPPGNPNSIAYYDPLGVTITTDANLTAFPLDPFGRPQIWDKRLGGAGAVYRNGSWTQDGDPTDVTGDGIVSYGPNALGAGPNATDGGYARITPTRFGLAQVIASGPLTYAWRVDYTQQIMRDDAGATTFSVARATGDGFLLSSLMLGLDTRLRRVAPSGGVPQVVVDDNGFAAGAVNVIPASDGISKLGTRSVADGGSDPVSVRWAEVNAVAVNTGDLNMISEERDAHWTLVEERDRIVAINRKTGRRYAIALTPIEEEE